ncbi:MAG: PCRF domain-containing protein, partial [Desulfamplus sp.]|nr:PCRF domain-containing protein [Desulfamplus sp.]
MRELESFIAKEDFWNDTDKATTLLKERTRISELIDAWELIHQDIEDADTLLALAREEADKDAELEVENLVTELEKKVKKFSI